MHNLDNIKTPFKLIKYTFSCFFLQCHASIATFFNAMCARWNGRLALFVTRLPAVKVAPKTPTSARRKSSVTSSQLPVQKETPYRLRRKIKQSKDNLSYGLFFFSIALISTSVVYGPRKFVILLLFCLFFILVYVRTTQ